MKQGEKGVVIYFILQDTDGNVYDLTTATSVKLYIEKGNTIAVRDAEIYSPTEGKIRYTIQEGDLDIGNANYKFQVAVDFQDGTHLVSDAIIEHVEGTLEAQQNGGN